MRNYKLTIQYDGSGYKGWQRLGDTDHTIQTELERILSQVLGESIAIVGCSRTDAGVHALAQIANFITAQELDMIWLKQNLNLMLPRDIRVVDVTEVAESFHSRYLAKEKIYLYKIWNKDYTNPFMRKYSMQVADALDLMKMKRAAEYFLGEHDFTAFSNAKGKHKSAIREIYEITFTEAGGFIEIRIRGNGFLYNMVRWMIGTLVDIGLGRLEVKQLPAMLEAGDRGGTGNLAAACGLYLERIIYERNA